MWVANLVLGSKTEETAAGVFTPRANEGQIDTRAMRKLSGVGDEVQMTVDNDSGATVTVEATGMLLLMKP